MPLLLSTHLVCLSLLWNVFVGCAYFVCRSGLQRSGLSEIGEVSSLGTQSTLPTRPPPPLRFLTFLALFVSPFPPPFCSSQ